MVKAAGGGAGCRGSRFATLLALLLRVEGFFRLLLFGLELVVSGGVA